MNIREAKQEIIDTVQAYLAKDRAGEYMIPPEKQRPVLLIGPPGIGKTAIMQQASSELGINLVSYTITHHTRQSAIGLPFIVKKNYGGKEVSVTEYTMSEIVASIYDQIELSGIKEGILFLDEINCVSETLAPTMLQFLQYKTFGTHKVPDGFVIVTAGNPPEYNKSVRDFDIVTLDRVKRIDLEADYDAWKEYAYRAGVHGSVMAYLEIRKQNFYSVKTENGIKRFATPRGWEDLSKIITVYEKLGKPVTEKLAVQYIQDRRIASDFGLYYELYNKYRKVYRVPDILEGGVHGNDRDLKNAPFDEKLSLISLLVDSLNGEFRDYAESSAVQSELAGVLKGILAEDCGDLPAVVSLKADSISSELERRVSAGLYGREEIRTEKLAAAALKELAGKLARDNRSQAARDWFNARERNRQDAVKITGEHLANCFRFLSEAYGENQEIVIFISELAGDYYALKYIRECGSDEYYKYNKLLLLKDQRSAIQGEIRKLM